MQILTPIFDAIGSFNWLSSFLQFLKESKKL